MLALLFAAYAWNSPENQLQDRDIQSLTIIDSGVQWRLAVVNSIVWKVHLSRNGKRVATYGDGDDGLPIQRVHGAFFGISIPKLRAPFKIAAIRGHSGAGHGQQTLFLGFRNGKVFQMGFDSEGTEVGGPINYDGRSDLWLFDDYDWYTHYDLATTSGPPNFYGISDPPPPLHRRLYHIGANGKLQYVRKWVAPARKKLPDTVGIRF